MWNCCQLYVTGDGRGDAGVRGVCEGAALWGEWKVYAVCSLQNVFSKECVF
jgi:hypothetical protein